MNFPSVVFAWCGNSPHVWKTNQLPKGAPDSYQLNGVLTSNSDGEGPNDDLADNLQARFPKNKFVAQVEALPNGNNSPPAVKFEHESSKSDFTIDFTFAKELKALSSSREISWIDKALSAKDPEHYPHFVEQVFIGKVKFSSAIRKLFGKAAEAEGTLVVQGVNYDCVPRFEHFMLRFKVPKSPHVFMIVGTAKARN